MRRLRVLAISPPPPSTPFVPSLQSCTMPEFVELRVFIHRTTAGAHEKRHLFHLCGCEFRVASLTGYHMLRISGIICVLGHRVHPLPICCPSAL